MGAVHPFMGIHPHIDREAHFFLKYLDTLPGWNVI